MPTNYYKLKYNTKSIMILTSQKPPPARNGRMGVRQLARSCYCWPTSLLYMKSSLPLFLKLTVFYLWTRRLSFPLCCTVLEWKSFSS